MGRNVQRSRRVWDSHRLVKIMDRAIRKALLKTVTFRAVAIMVTMIVAYCWTGKWMTSIGITITANLIKMALYYWHERVWETIC